jgi:hypothetical protein
MRQRAAQLQYYCRVACRPHRAVDPDACMLHHKQGHRILPSLPEAEDKNGRGGRQSQPVEQHDKMDSTEIVQLAAIISRQTSLISDHLHAANLSPPSFEPGAAIDVVPESLEPARNLILDATAKLQELLLGPTDLILRHDISSTLSRVTIKLSCFVGESSGQLARYLSIRHCEEFPCRS